MHVVVVGCGRVGLELANRLLSEGHSVCVVDKNPRSLKRLGQDFAGDVVVGLGFDLDTLREAGIERAAALAAVTSGDNSNILIARVARENFGLRRVVARIQDPARAEIYERLGISTVASVRWATDQIARRLVPDDEHAEWMDPSGLVRLLEIPVPDAWAGRVLDPLEQSGRWRIVALTRVGAAGVFVPGTIGQAGDLLHIVVADDAVGALRQRLDEVSGGVH